MNAPEAITPAADTAAPDGQRAAVSSPDRVTAPSVRVRLIGGARVLA